MRQKIRAHIFIIVVTFFVLSIVLLFFPLKAEKSPAEIQAIIDAKKNESAVLTDKLAAITNNIDKLSNQKLKTLGELNNAKVQVNEISKTIDSVKEEIEKKKESNIQLLETNKDIEQDLFGHIRLIQSQSIAVEDSETNAIPYLKKFIEIGTEEIKVNTDYSKNIQAQIDNQTSELTKLTKHKESLDKKTKEIESQIKNLSTTISNSNSNYTQIKTSINSINKDLEKLTKEQADAIKREQEILSKAKAATQVIQIKGDIVFKGRGRDLYDGHAVGLSQFGSYGAGKAGMQYKNILKSYFTGVEIAGGYDDIEINIAGQGKMNIEDYLAGLGEIPSKACKTDSNKDADYTVADNADTVWDCFPEETIKAQIVAARSYAVSHVLENPNKAYATNDSFQVYVGGDAKKWAVDKTKGEVITLNTKPVAAYFTASARGLTENNEYVWTSKSYSTKSIDEIKGTPLSYLKSINESSWAYRSNTYDFKWQTSSFSLNTLTQILKPLTSDLGLLKTISTHKGNSNRIWALTLEFEKQKVYIASWKFKAMINEYLYNKNSDTNYLFSTEFTIEKAN